jgi:hypothetical protein
MRRLVESLENAKPASNRLLRLEVGFPLEGTAELMLVPNFLYHDMMNIYLLDRFWF